ncbi:MAG: class I SAM-dependent methyltransferase [Proteobacteria bacterium]|nr:class I SAM-dependent methyltransferase [Pseudomonadota bacterium]
MKTSPTAAVRQMYEASADHYATMMDAEIELPVYADTLGRLAGRIASVAGPVLDVSCGPGQMLELYGQRFDAGRPLVGVDLSPRMVELATARLSAEARVVLGDMSVLSGFADASVAAIINFFAVHHLNPSALRAALAEWHRVLAPGGQLVVAAWEGSGVIDYGEHADIVALRYAAAELNAWSEQAGFAVSRCDVEDVADFPMDAVYLEAGKA